MSNYVSPFAIKFPKMPPVKGVNLSSAHTGMRYKNRDDVILVEMPEGTTVAGVFTKNSMCGVPVDWCKSIMKNGKARGLLVNAGIANVFTGEAGKKTCANSAKEIAKILDCDEKEIFVSSTGIIGELINEEKLLATIPTLKKNLGANNWEVAARAIMTTDTFAKAVSRTADIGGKRVTINGIIKGSGMIAPNMATMLGYVFTDAKIPAKILQELMDEVKDISYNSITVDSDTSTSDTVLAFATGQVDHWEIKSAKGDDLADFKEKFFEVHIELAKLVAKDGEGISKFVTINVRGAKTNESARKIGLSIANSPLLKTAITGGDPNWGRIVAAAGKSGEPTNRDKTCIWVGDQMVGINGGKYADYDEREAINYMKNSEVEFSIDVGVGKGEARVWTMDLTAEYIKINVDYRS